MHIIGASIDRWDYPSGKNRFFCIQLLSNAGVSHAVVGIIGDTLLIFNKISVSIQLGFSYDIDNINMINLRKGDTPPSEECPRLVNVTKIKVVGQECNN